MSDPQREFTLLYLGQMRGGLKERLEQAAPGITALEAATPALALERAPRAEVIAGSGHSFSPELVASAAKLRWVQALSAGVEGICPRLAGRNVLLTNARGAHAIPIAEHFLALLLALTRRLPEFWLQKQQKQWRRLDLEEARGKTLLILGLGNIGREVAAAASGLGLRILAYDPYHATPVPPVDRLCRMDGLPGALAEADFVLSALPLTPANRGFVGAAEFAAMRPGTYFFNVSRGGVVDEPALVAALRSGHLGGAGLDVFAQEPLAASSPLWDFLNVIITPHSAASSPRTNLRVEDILVENTGRYVRGKPLVNLVDVDRGF